MDNQYFFNSSIPPPLPMPTWQTPAAAYIGGGSNNPNNSCYTTPSNSPPQLKFLIMNHSVKENLPNLGTPMAVNPNLPTLTADPGFAERAAKFSSLGSRSFNGRTSQLASNNTELQYRSSPLMGIETIPRVLSSPSLKAAGSPMGVQENRNFTQTHMNLGEVSRYSALDRTEFASSNEGSSVSEQIPNGENVVLTPSDSNSKKRKSVSRGKSKVAESEDELNTKRSKSTESYEIENDNGAGDEDQKQEKTNPKPAEPLKDYIHVRARRGQATDSHSLAERVRREKIGERMKLLQDLVPGCNKVTGKALMLDEIINYVQSLQRQVEFLSMKLASVNPGLDFDTDSIFSKDVSQSNDSYPHPIFPFDSSASRFFGQSHKNPSNLVVSQCSMDPLDTALCQNIGTMVDEFGQVLPQFLTLCEDDLQSIVQMGLGRSPDRDMGFHSQSFPGSSQTSHMKIEL